jgi:aryl-alcohol dehydrogenase-like predicted oxidoreductase
MQYRQLGRTGAFVSELALGAGTFGGDMPQDSVNAMVRCALDHGVNFFDTADFYMAGQSEVMLGQAFRNLAVTRSDLFVASKVQNPVGPGPNDRGASRLHILDGVQRSLERMQLDHFDLYQIHSHDPVTPLEETMRALDDLVSQGLVRYVGASNWPAWRLSKAKGICDKRGWNSLVSTQAYYCLSGRDIERELVACCLEEDIGILAWSPLDGGFLTGTHPRDGAAMAGTRQSKLQGFPPVNRPRAWDCVDVMREITAELDGATIPQIAIAWVLAQPGVSSVLLGAQRLEQLVDTLGAVRVVLSGEHLARLDAASALPSEYPDWLLSKQAPSRWPQTFDPDA